MTNEHTTHDQGTSAATVAPERPPASARPQRKAEPQRPRLWHVVLLDDDEHSYEYVIAMMQTLFGHPLERAFQIAQKVDAEGRAVCLTTHREHAELKLKQIRGFGADPLIASCVGAMGALLEPADYDGDGEGGGDGAGR